MSGYLLRKLNAPVWLLVFLFVYKLIGWYGEYHYLLPWHEG